MASGVAIIWRAMAGYPKVINWIWPAVVIFVVLTVVHEYTLRKLRRAQRAAGYFERGLARLANDWAGRGETGESYQQEEHPYALDLDIFGKGSLFELLSTARTRIGEDTLAGWLLKPAPPNTIFARQQAVDELRPRLDLREKLAVLAEDARTGVDPIALANWGEAPPLSGLQGLRRVTYALTSVGLMSATGLALFLARVLGFPLLSPDSWLLLRDVIVVGLVVNGLFLVFSRGRTEPVLTAVRAAASELRLLSEVLVCLEQEGFHTRLLVELRKSLDAEGRPPSQRLAGLRNLVEHIESRDNIFVRISELFVLWSPHLALRVEHWRQQTGSAVRRWVTATGEIEALCSLASHAFEHPEDPFPEIVDGSPLLEASAVAHPLLPVDRMVRNDVHIGHPARVLIISGSNMSGKSTLLRTLGINVVLAQAGATVRAHKLRLSPLGVGGSIHLRDSLQAGVSRFYAEIRRLRQIVGLTDGPLPVLFLIDEALHGTNSHDRRIGANAVVRSLVERGAIGLITTHDLALADIVDSLDERAANFHFEDHVKQGTISFDYIMRPGVVTKSNAIELMRSVGLKI